MKRLLVPVDFSDNARDALRYGLQLAAGSGFEVVCLHVTKIHTRTHYFSPQELTNLEQDALQEAQGKLTAFIAEAQTPESAAVVLHPRVRIGFALEEIIAQCHDESYYAIVMGTKGGNNLRDKLLGANTANVIESVSVPVLTIPLGAVYKPIDHLTYLCNIENVNLPAMGRLLGFANAVRARVMLLHFDTATDYTRTGSAQAMEQLVARALSADGLQVTVKQAESVSAGVAAYLRTDTDGLMAISLRDRSVYRKIFAAALDDETRKRMHVPILTLHA
jgi:nucleotide-binding universal stress UspA family protein